MATAAGLCHRSPGHQFHFPASRSSAGPIAMRTIVASSRTAAESAGVAGWELGLAALLDAEGAAPRLADAAMIRGALGPASAA